LPAGFKPFANSAQLLLSISGTGYGITQLLFSESLNAELDANPLGREFVLQVIGTVNERSNKNANIPTGDIEILVTSFKILNKAATPPFTIQDDTDGGDDLRMKYRFLDLRRNAGKKKLRTTLCRWP
jgi:aspartyl-tRNA synthetase